MSVYYVDLELDSNANYVENNPEQPMGWAEFKSFYVENSQDIVHEMKIKGFKNAVEESKITSGLSLTPWGKYDTWGLNIGTIGNSEVEGSNNGSWDFKNGTVYCKNLVQKSTGSLEVSDSTVVCDNLKVSTSSKISVNLSFLRVKESVDPVGEFKSFRDLISLPVSQRLVCGDGKFLDTDFNVGSDGDWGASTFRNCNFNRDMSDMEQDLVEEGVGEEL